MDYSLKRVLFRVTVPHSIRPLPTLKFIVVTLDHCLVTTKQEKSANLGLSSYYRLLPLTKAYDFCGLLFSLFLLLSSF